MGKTWTHRKKKTVRRIGAGSTTDNFLFHSLLNGDFRQRSAIIALVAANPPFFNPLFLHI